MTVEYFNSICDFMTAEVCIFHVSIRNTCNVEIAQVWLYDNSITYVDESIMTEEGKLFIEKFAKGMEVE